MTVSEEGMQDGQDLVAQFNRAASMFVSSYRMRLTQCLPGRKQAVLLPLQQAIAYANGMQEELHPSERFAIKGINKLTRSLLQTMLERQAIDRLHWQLLEIARRMQTETNADKLNRLIGQLNDILNKWLTANEFEGEGWPPHLIDGMAIAFRELARSMEPSLGIIVEPSDAADVTPTSEGSLQRSMRRSLVVLTALHKHFNAV